MGIPRTTANLRRGERQAAYEQFIRGMPPRDGIQADYNNQFRDTMQRRLIAQLDNPSHNPMQTQALIYEIANNPHTRGVLKLPFYARDRRTGRRYWTTPLIYALKNFNTRAAIFLLQSGAQLNTESQDESGLSALDYAQNSGNRDLIYLIQQAINEGRNGGRKTKKRSINKKRTTKSHYKSKRGTRRR
jgi:hypothetical protein